MADTAPFTRQAEPGSGAKRPRGAARRLIGWRWAFMGLVVFLSGCASNAPQDTLEPEGPIARSIDNLAGPVFMIAGVVFVLVEVGVLFLAWRFRKRPTDAEDDDLPPPQVHGNIPLELGWTILPALILTVVAVMTVTTIFDIDSRRDDAAFSVDVIGRQWWWEYRYDLDGDGSEEIVTANDLVIPAGEAVELNVTSDDVIHSFWIPQLAGKMDAAPGRNHSLVLETDEPGTFVGQCAEFCGLSHGYMRQRVVALPSDEYDAWEQNQLTPAEMPAEGTAAREGAELFTSMCSGCHLVEGVNDSEYDDQGSGTEELVAGPAPNLTHLMTRGAFAGALFNLWQPSEGEVTPQWSDIGEGGTLERENLATWLRNPPGQKPMAPDEGRGMPDFELTEEQIDSLIEFLQTLD